MATRFLRYDSDPILRKKCKAVLKVDDKIRQLLDDMLDTLHETENGAALAANQVGVLKRIFIVDINVDKSDIREFINPEIIKKKGKNDKYLEGCLSFPGRSFKIVRPEKVTVRAQNLSGDWFTFEAEDFIARALMHENDHLDGITIPQIGKEVFE